MYLLQRAYDFTADDLPAVLADRLWSRGLRKERLENVPWVKAVTPSNTLRQWFHQDKTGRWDEFCRRYRAELAAPEVRQLCSHCAPHTNKPAA